MSHELACSMGSRNLMLLYDIGNSFTAARRLIPEAFSQPTLLDEYEAIKSRVRCFHIKDYEKTAQGFRHVAFGKGDIAYNKLFSCIKRDDRDVIVSLEPEVKAHDLETSITTFLKMM